MRHYDCKNYINLDCEKGMCALSKGLVPTHSIFIWIYEVLAVSAFFSLFEMRTSLTSFTVKQQLQ
jgi:hypothetical protein